MTVTTILDCGHAPTPDSGIGTGSAIRPDGTRICYPCADDEQQAHVADPETRRVVAYTSMDGRKVTTWTGGTLMRIVHRTDNGRQSWIRARAHDGSLWFGQGPSGLGMYVSLKRVSR